MNIFRELQVGDAIICKGIRAEIAEILYQDAYFSDYVPEDRHYINIEFNDTTGKYRHWKSHLDGGKVEYKDKDLAELQSVMKKYSSENISGYIVPFDDVDEYVSKHILSLLKSDYVMVVCSFDGISKSYVITSVSGKKCSELHNCREELYDWLHKDKGVHYFTKMSLDEYSQSTRYQEAIDYVLEKANYPSNSINGWGIALKVNEKGMLEFIEVLDLF